MERTNCRYNKSLPTKALCTYHGGAPKCSECDVDSAPDDIYNSQAFQEIYPNPTPHGAEQLCLLIASLYEEGVLDGETKTSKG